MTESKRLFPGLSNSAPQVVAEPLTVDITEPKKSGKLFGNLPVRETEDQKQSRVAQLELEQNQEQKQKDEFRKLFLRDRLGVEMSDDEKGRLVELSEALPSAGGIKTAELFAEMSASKMPEGLDKRYYALSTKRKAELELTPDETRELKSIQDEKDREFKEYANSKIAKE